MPDVTTVLRAAVEEEPPLGFGASDVIARGRAVRRRRMAVRAAAGAGAAAVTAAAVIAAAVGAGAGGGAVRARTAAYVVSRVEKALARQHLVLRGRTTTTAGPTISWAYGPRNRFEELTGRGLRSRPARRVLHPPRRIRALPRRRDRAHRREAHRRLRHLLQPRVEPAAGGAIPASACSRTGAFQMAGPPIPTSDWPAFIRATLACGAATVTRHVQIGGQETLKITGSPATIKLPPGSGQGLSREMAAGPVDPVREPQDVPPGAAVRLGVPVWRPGTQHAVHIRNRHAVAAADRRQHRQNPGHHPRRVPPGELTGRPVAAGTGRSAHR